jgi:hypothetical protein
MLLYHAALPLWSRTLRYAAGIIRRHRKAIGSRRRKLNPGQQALLVLAYLRIAETFADLAVGFSAGTTVCGRDHRTAGGEGAEAACGGPDAAKAGHACIVVDGTPSPPTERPGQEQTQSQKDTNRAHAKLRAPRRARARPAQDLAHPPQAPLLPLESRAARQSQAQPAGAVVGALPAQ